MKKLVIASAALIALLGVVPGTSSRTDLVGDGATRVFYFAFKTTDTANLVITVDGMQPPPFSMYLNVNQDASPGGVVTFVNPLESGAKLRIERTIPLVQPNVFAIGTPYRPKNVEYGVADRIVMQMQQIQRQLDDLAALVALGGGGGGGGSGGPDARLPIGEPGKYLVWGTDGKLHNVTFDQMLDAISGPDGSPPAGLKYYLAIPAGADMTAPVITAFTMPATSGPLTVALTFTAMDDTSVTGYYVSESATTPAAGAAGWTVTAPTSFTFAAAGTDTLHGWAKDASGNVSLMASATVAVSGPSQVVQPVFAPAPGTFATSQSVAMSTTTSGATIMYAFGSDPTCAAGNVYSTPVSVPMGADSSLRAIACKTGLVDSAVTSGTYHFKVASPVYSPIAGTYVGEQTVSISSSTPGATIRYLMNGSSPTCSTGLIYSSPFTVSTSLTSKAIACYAAMTDSDVTTAAYAIDTPRVATPTFSPVAGAYGSAQSVAITTTTTAPDTYINYTTDGTTPTCSTGTLYSSAVSVSSTTTLKAIGCRPPLYLDSAVAVATYTIGAGGTVATPAFTPNGGSFSAGQNVTLASTTSGSTVYYSTTNATPSCASTGSLSMAGSAGSAGGTVFVASSSTLYAIGCLTGWTQSSTASATFTITPPPAGTPTFSPGAGTYVSAQSVTISSSNSDYIKYRIDGTAPTCSTGTTYTGAISISSTTTVQAVGCATGGDSAVASATYTISAGGAGVTYVGAGELYANAAATVGMATVAMPAGIQTGDLLVLYTNGGLASDPAGWTAIIAGDRNAYWKRAGASESSVSLDFDDYGGEGAPIAARTYAWRGVVGSGSPFDVKDSAWTTYGSNTITGSALTTTANGSMIVMLAGSASVSRTVVSVSGSVNQSVSGANAIRSLSMAYGDTPPNAGTQPAPVMTLSTGGVSGSWLTFALKKG